MVKFCSDLQLLKKKKKSLYQGEQILFILNTNSVISKRGSWHSVLCVLGPSSANTYARAHGKV